MINLLRISDVVFFVKKIPLAKPDAKTPAFHLKRKAGALNQLRNPNVEILN